MSEMHALVSVFPSLKGTGNTAINNTKSTFKNRQHQFNGHIKSYQPITEGGQEEHPEHVPMVLTVGEELVHFRDMFSPFLDAEAQICETNTNARASVELDGFTLENAPATLLLQLEKHIESMRSVFSEIPVLDGKHQWEEDDQQGEGVFKSKPEITHRTKKELQHKVLFDGDEHHPPQIEKWQEDVRVGTYTTERHSGLLTIKQKIGLLRRLDLLQQAVKRARSEANKIKHNTDKVADQIFEYLFDGIPLVR